MSGSNFGGPGLDAAIRRAVAESTDAARIEAVRTLLNFDLIAPVTGTPPESGGAAGDVDPERIPVVTDALARRALPLFSDSDRLRLFALTIGWETETFVTLPAREALKLARDPRFEVAVIDPGGPFPFELDPAEAGRLAEERPDAPAPAREPAPAPEPVLPMPTAAAPEPVPSSAAGTPKSEVRPKPSEGKSYVAKPSVKVPDRLAGVLKVLLEQFAYVRRAILFEHVSSDGNKLVLGLVLEPRDKPLDPQLRKPLASGLARFLPGASPQVVALPEELEPAVMAACKPIYEKF